MAISQGMRQREMNRRAKQEEKARRKEIRKTESAQRPATPGEDPDIAGIVPGPQPIVED